MSLPSLPWKPCKSHEDFDGPYFEPDDPETLPYTSIQSKDGAVFTAHDLFTFAPGVAEHVCRAVNVYPSLVKALAIATRRDVKDVEEYIDRRLAFLEDKAQENANG